MSAVDEYDWKNRIEDVGEIVGCTFSVYYGPWIAIKTKEWEYHCCCKPTFAVGEGTLSVTKESVDSGERYSHLCNDPRVVFMYLFLCKKYFAHKKIKEIPIPTMEQAIEWLQEADVPIRWNLYEKGSYNKGGMTEKQRKFLYGY